MIANPPIPQILGVGVGVGEVLFESIRISPIYQILNINCWMEKKCKLVHSLVECNMNCGNMYVVDPTMHRCLS
jgi:hypothetical protein